MSDLTPTYGEGTEYNSTKLRLLTYLSPGLPLELFQTYQHYLEEVLGCYGILSVESRWRAPPPGRKDPFTADDADMVFMCSPGFVRLYDAHNPFMELLPVAPVFDHPLIDGKPLYYSDVIVRSEKLNKYKEFADLRGHRWAVNDRDSLSGNISVLNELKSIGVNASFFGHIVHTESHHENIKLVLNNVVDAAAIDSNVLRFWLEEHPQYKEELHVLSSWGPWPIQPIALNTRIAAETKTKIADALLKVHDHPEFGKLFEKFGVKCFKHIDVDFYNSVRDAVELSKSENLYPAYY